MFITEASSVLLGFAVLFGIYLWFKGDNKNNNEKKASGRKSIPGPKLVDKKLGHSAEIQATGLSQYLRQQHTIYGPVFGFYQGETYTVSLGSTSTFNQTRKLFDRPRFVADMFKPVFGDNTIEAATGEEGKIRHAAYTKFLSFGAISPYFPLIHQKVIAMCSTWLSLKGPVEVRHELRKYSILAVEAIVFRGHMQNDEEALKFIDMFEQAWVEVERFTRDDVMPPGSEREKHFNQCMKIINTTVRDIYKTSLEEKSDDNKTTFYSMSKEINLDDSTIMDDLIGMVMGGFHNSAFLIEWGMYYLARYPDIQEKMYQEIQDVLGDEPITPEAVKHLVYVRQFIDETQRWVTIGQLCARISDEDMEIDGYTIPANTPIFQALETVHFDETIYQDPDRFNPDRFSPENRKMLPPHSLEPFGFSGGRRCMGWQVFNTEATILFTTLLQKSQLCLPPNEEDIRKAKGTWSRPDRNVRVIFTGR